MVQPKAPVCWNKHCQYVLHYTVHSEFCDVSVNFTSAHLIKHKCVLQDKNKMVANTSS